jgi:hypothetical protein
MTSSCARNTLPMRCNIDSCPCNIGLSIASPISTVLVTSADHHRHAIFALSPLLLPQEF